MASARENDLNPNVYIGLALPIKPDDNNIFSLTKNSFDQVRHNLRNLLLTNVGERVYQPEFGSRLRELCFEQLDESLPQRVEDEVRRAVNFWLPYVNIVEVETLTQEDNKSKIFGSVFGFKLIPVTFAPSIFNHKVSQLPLKPE